MRMQVCMYKKYIYHSEEQEGGAGRWIENYLTQYNAAFQWRVADIYQAAYWMETWGH